MFTPNTPRILNSFMIDTTDGATDCINSNGNIVFKKSGTAWGTTIPLRQVNQKRGYVKTAYAAGTAKVVTIEITGTPEVGKYYRFGLKKWTGKSGLVVDTPYYDERREYTVTPAAATAASLASALKLAIEAAYDEGRDVVDASVSTATVTLTALNALFDFNIDSPDVAATIAVGTPYVKPAGAYDEVYAINKGAVSGGTYDRHSYRIFVDTPAAGLQGQNQREEVQLIVFVKLGITNKSALDTQIAAVNGGTNLDDTTATTLKASVAEYVGIV